MGADTGLTARPARAVFDTNVAVSALVFGGRLAWLRAGWEARRVIPVVCRETVTELLRVLAYPKFRLSADRRDILLSDYLPYAEAVPLPQPWPDIPTACRDRDDRVFVALTLAADADFLVSGDADLTTMSGSLSVLSPTDLHERLGRAGQEWRR